MESQERRGEYDISFITLEAYQDKVERGDPRALDSLFAPAFKSDINPNALAGTIDNWKAIQSFKRVALAYLVEPTLKNRHHYHRVLMNLEGLLRNGRYDPRTTAFQRYLFTCTDHLADDDWRLWAVRYADLIEARMKMLL